MTFAWLSISAVHQIFIFRLHVNFRWCNRLLKCYGSIQLKLTPNFLIWYTALLQICFQMCLRNFRSCLQLTLLTSSRKKKTSIKLLFHNFFSACNCVYNNTVSTFKHCKHAFSYLKTYLFFRWFFVLESPLILDLIDVLFSWKRDTQIRIGFYNIRPPSQKWG